MFCQHCRPSRGSLIVQKGWPSRTLTWQVSCRQLRVSVSLCVLYLRLEGSSWQSCCLRMLRFLLAATTRLQCLKTAILQRRTVQCRSVSEQPSSCQVWEKGPQGRCCRGALWQQLPWPTGQLQPGELHMRFASIAAGQWQCKSSALVMKMRSQPDAQQSRHTVS